MPKLNTLFSYSLRSLVVVHLTYLGLLAKMRPGNPSSDTKLTVAFEALMVLVGISLIADWVTPKDPSRRFSKLIDSLLGIGWLVVMAATTLYGLSMGTL